MWDYIRRIETVKRANLIATWGLEETNPSKTYTASDAWINRYHAAAFGGGAGTQVYSTVANPQNRHLGLTVNGLSTAIRIGLSGVSAKFNPDIGSAIMWGKVDGASRWTDSAQYRYTFHFKTVESAIHYVVFGKSATNHQLVWRRRAGGNANEQVYNFSPSGPLTWFSQGYAWDISVPRLRGYLFANGSFATVFDVAGVNMDTIADKTFADDNTVLLAGALASQNWIGSGWAGCVWAGATLNASEFQYLMEI